eukprot:5991075-Amphidinium_carterae.1
MQQSDLERKVLSSISETSTLLAEVQRTWDFLENLFIHSEEAWDSAVKDLALQRAFPAAIKIERGSA